MSDLCAVQLLDKAITVTHIQRDLWNHAILTNRGLVHDMLSTLGERHQLVL
jgi:hypothetical protein